MLVRPQETGHQEQAQLDEQLPAVAGVQEGVQRGDAVPGEVAAGQRRDRRRAATQPAARNPNRRSRRARTRPTSPVRMLSRRPAATTAPAQVERGQHVHALGDDDHRVCAGSGLRCARAGPPPRSPRPRRRRRPPPQNTTVARCFGPPRPARPRGAWLIDDAGGAWRARGPPAPGAGAHEQGGPQGRCHRTAGRSRLHEGEGSPEQCSEQAGAAAPESSRWSAGPSADGFSGWEPSRKQQREAAEVTPRASSPAQRDTGLEPGRCRFGALLTGAAPVHDAEDHHPWGDVQVVAGQGLPGDAVLADTQWGRPTSSAVGCSVSAPGVARSRSDVPARCGRRRR